MEPTPTDGSRGSVELRYSDAELRGGVSLRVAAGGDAWRLSLTSLPVAQPPALRVAPELVGNGKIGSEHEVTPGEWSGQPAPELTFAWLRNGVEIPGATGQKFVPDADDDVSAISCRVEARNAAGTAVATTSPRTMTYPRPAAGSDRIEETLDDGAGPRTIDVSAFFLGDGLTFSLTGTGASIDPATGVVTVTADGAPGTRELVISARNSGGSASLTLLVTRGPETGQRPTIGFAGPALVQILFDEGAIDIADPVAVEGGDGDGPDLDPNDRFGGEGSLGGIAGNFSGRRNAGQPQLFTPWPEYRATAHSGLFAPTGAAGNRSIADDADVWRVEVNGTARPVAAVHRRTVPIATRLVEAGTWRSARRHLVTLTLATALSPGDAVSVTPPGDDVPVHQAFRADVRSESVHVCHLGYPLGGPKKGYVGLWLGHDGSGANGTTDAALAAATPWRLVRVGDGATVAGGMLALAKPRGEPHASGVNYNGCDIHVADFSGFDAPGTYRLEVEGVGSSVPFSIGGEPYAEALRLAGRAFFFQRSGCAIPEASGEGLTRPRNGHPADGLTVYQTDIRLGRHSEGFTSGSDVFPVLHAWPLETVTGEGLGTEHVPADALSSAGAWRALPSSYALSAGRLTISGSGYRNGDLDLAGALRPGSEYRITIEVAELAAAGAGLVARLAGAGALHLFRPLNQGTNTIRVRADAAYPRLHLDANGTTTAIVSAISVREVTAEGSRTPTATNPDAWGGWHDAGDWDRRIQHMDTVYVMAQIVETFPATRRLHLNIPESGRAFAHGDVAARKDAADTGDGATVLPDLIHEALWGISLWRRTQGAEGGIIGGVEYSLDGIEGSVSWNPVQTTYAYAEEEWAAYLFAAAAAKLGHVVATACGDTVLGQALIGEAEAAWGWAEDRFATGLDAANGRDGDPATVAAEIMVARLRAAASLYRAAGRPDARAVFESYNAFRAVGTTGLSRAGTVFGTRGDYALQALDYARAGREGRAVVAGIAAEIDRWCANRPAVDGAHRMGSDYGLHNTGLYGWGASWFRFGPASNWWASRSALALIAGGATADELREAVLEGMWFALGCNPSNVSLVQGLGPRQFSDPLVNDFSFPGLISVGPAAGPLEGYETGSMGDSLYPATDAAWPHYTRIFETGRVVRSAEFGIKSNMMEWLFACAFANADVAPD